MNTKQALLAALALIEQHHYRPTGDKRYLAVNAWGKRVPPLHPDARAWSTIGALEKVAPAAEHYPAGWDAFGYLEDAAKELGYDGTPYVDMQGKVRVIQMFWKAIDAEEAARARGVQVPS